MVFYISNDISIPIEVRCDSLINDFYSFLIERKWDITIFAHNFSGFDGTFLLKWVLENIPRDEFKVLIPDHKILLLELSKYGIKFQDSYRLLPSSLAKLAKSAGLEAGKTLFPYNFVKEDTLFYRGPKPDIKIYEETQKYTVNSIVYTVNKKKVSLEEYNSIHTYFDTQKESESYCLNDCILLYEVIKYNRKVFDDIVVSVLKKKGIVTPGFIDLPSYLTSAQLSMNIFNKVFMEQENMYIPKNKEEDTKHREAYLGGRCEVYNKKCKEGWNMMAYDANSLYPAMMMKNEYPVGEPIQIQPDDIFVKEVLGKPILWVRSLDVEFFGLVRVNIKTPEYMHKPFLMLNMFPSKGNVSPLGRFCTTLLSPEINKALSLGYTLEKVLEADHFNKSNKLFVEFIETFYEIRKQSPKGSAVNEMTKQTMNGCSGRFALKPYDEIELVVDSENEYQMFCKVFKDLPKTLVEGTFVNKTVVGSPTLTRKIISVTNKIDIMGCYSIIGSIRFLEKFLIHYNTRVKQDRKFRYTSSPLITAFITSYSRIWMYELSENVKHGIFHYTDTDSLMISWDPKNIWHMEEKAKMNSFCNDNLGALKVEFDGEDGIFHAPKVYKLGEKVKCKGLPDDYKDKVVEKLNEDEFSVSEFDIILYVYSKILEIGLKKGVKTVTKELRKRKECPDKINTEPLRYPEDFDMTKLSENKFLVPDDNITSNN
jgi:hypothetical protein